MFFGRNQLRRRIIFALALVVMFNGSPAYADCVSPAAVAGAVIYNTDHATMQFCNGTTWVSMSGGSASASGAAGGVQFSGASNVFAADATTFFWDNTAKALGIGTATPAATAALDVTSTTKGFLPPRMTTAQRDAIASPAEGLMVYNTDTKSFDVRVASSWLSFGGSQSGSTMVSGWPDAIRCTYNTGSTRTLYLQNSPHSDGKYWYTEAIADASNYYSVLFTSAGAYDSGQGIYASAANHDCDMSIAALYAAGRAFNFVGGSGSGSATACPSGFTQITSAGNALGCMQNTDTGPAASWNAAANACFTTYGGRLPTSTEWYLAMNNYALTNETGNWEWLSENTGDESPWDNHAVAGNTAITDFGYAGDTINTFYSRCFIPASGGGGGSVSSDSLDFTEFKDALTLDASTDIALDGTENLSFTNTGTGSSLRVNDVASDTTSFIIDDAGNVAIGANATVTANKAILQLDSTTQGFLPPRMTTAQRDAIASPSTGLTVYNTTTNTMNVYNGSAWTSLSNTGEYSASALRSSTATLNHNSWTAITFTNEDFDNGNMIDIGGQPTRITIPAGAGGRYLVTGFLGLDAADTGGRWLDIWLNGASVSRYCNVPASSLLGGALGLSCSALMNLAAGDYLQLYAYQNSGSARTIQANTRLAAFKITGGGDGGGSSQWTDVTGGLSYASGGAVVGTATLNTTAILQADSTTKGFLPPRMTTAQRDAISSPATGLTIYNTTTSSLNVWNGTGWQTASGTGSACTFSTQTFSYTGSNQSFVVPAGCDYIQVKAWGGGGGGGYNSLNGGPGGFTSAVIPVTPGETLTLVVGRQGIRNTTTTGSLESNGYGYAGAAYSGSSACAVGHGGGLAGVFRGSPAQGTALVIAGGGGGSSGYTQGGAGNDEAYSGGVTGSMTGTNGTSTQWIPGAGGGYHGGTHHVRSSTNTSYMGGNGGKGFVTGSAIFGAMNSTTEFSVTAPGASDPDYPGGNVAKGGVGGTYGTNCTDAGHGAIVIKPSSILSGGGGSATPGGNTGAVQFNNAGALGGDETKLFWDNTNKRLGIGTGTLTYDLEIQRAANSGVVANIANSDAGASAYAGYRMQTDGGTSILYRTSNAYTVASAQDDTVLQDSGGGDIVMNPTAEAARFTASGNVGIGTATPAATALLDVTSTTKGFLPPRMTTTQRNAISSPATGLVIYNTSTNTLNMYNGTSWIGLTSGGMALYPPFTMPDIIVCTISGSDVVYFTKGHLSVASSETRYDTGPNGYVYYHNTTGAKGAATGAGSSNCPANISGVTATYNYGGSGANTSVMSGWPDAISCTVSTGQTAILYSTWHDSAGEHYYTEGFATGSADFSIRYNPSTGAYTTQSGRDYTSCKVNISAIVAAGKGFNFVGGGGSGSASASGAAGGVQFAGASNVFAADAATFFWDNTAKALGIGTATPAATAALDVTSTTKGFLPPRMTTTQRDAISSPATGLTVYNSNTNQLNYYNGTAWTALTTTSAASGMAYRTSSLALTNGSWIDVPLNTGNGSLSGVTHSTSTNPERMTVTSAGTYLVSYTLDLQFSAASTSQARVAVNGVAVTGSNSGTSQHASGYWASISRSVILNLSANDYVTLQGHTNWTANTANGAVMTIQSIGGSGGGGSVTPGGNTGAVQFNNAGALGGDETTLFWDNTNKRLGVGTATPGNKLHVVAPATDVFAAMIDGSNADTRMRVNNTAAVSTTNTSALDLSAMSTTQSRTAGIVQASLTDTTDATRTGWMRLGVQNSGTLDYVLNIVPGRVGIGTLTPAATSVLDLTSTTKGFLPPRMTTTQRDAISSPAAGLTIYNTTMNALNFYNGTTWVGMTGKPVETWSATSTGQILGSGTLTDLPGVTVTFTLTDSAQVMAFGEISMRSDSAVTNNASAAFVVDGVVQGNGTYGQQIMGHDGNTEGHTTFTISNRFTLAAGSHTIKIQGSTFGGATRLCSETGGTLADYKRCRLNLIAVYDNPWAGGGSIGTYQTMCTHQNGSAGNQFPMCCQMTIATGATTCKVGNSTSSPTAWTATTAAPFSAGTAGTYELSMTTGLNGVNFAFVCQSNKTSGATICKFANNWTAAGITSWTAVTNPF